MAFSNKMSVLLDKIERRLGTQGLNLPPELQKDVCGDRFEARQYKKSRKEGISYYMYLLIDNKHPERNMIVPWESAFSIYQFNHIWLAMNDFIVSSDFWQTYNK